MEFLFEKLKKDKSFTQIVFADKNKKAIKWLPGNKRGEGSYPDQYMYIGFTGKTFLDVKLTQHEQPYDLYWSALDIDEEIKDINQIIELVPEASIRSSVSGKHFHLYFRFENPLTYQSGESCQMDVKRINLPFKEKIESLGYKVDKYDNRVMYFSGGKNEWLYKSKLFIPVQKGIRKEIKKINTVEKINIKMTEEIVKFLSILKESGIFLKNGRNNTHIKSIYEILKNTEFAFKTNSPMQSGNWHINGFIDLTEKGIVIFANADEQPALILDNINF